MIQRIPFFHHDLGRAELEQIAKVFEGPILTTGDQVRSFEERFARLLGRKHALGVTSCTGALHLSLLALGIRPGDEVITTPMTFVATASAIVEAGAKPVFVDVESDTGNLDADKVEAAITSRTKAIVPVHLYGLMCDMVKLRAIADRHGLRIIEDAAHCIEGERDGIRPGQLSDVACFSFFATKNLTCGEGGALVTDNSELFEKLRLLRLHGITRTSIDRFRQGYEHWDMVTLGWKYNMDNIQAAMLLPQCDRIESNLTKRQELSDYYQRLLKTIPYLTVPATRPQSRHARHLFTVWVPKDHRDTLIGYLQSRGVGLSVNYRAIHLLSYFSDLTGNRRGDFPSAEQIGDCTISLPFYPQMPLDNAAKVADIISGYFDELN